MKSPITGKEMKLVHEKRTMEFRKEKYEIMFHHYHCADSGEYFTDNSLDELNLNQVYNQYRDQHNIPFPDEISRIREQYNLPASKMSEVLGFGVNGYRNYEAGEMPSVSNARLIQMINDPERFMEMLRLCESLDEKSREKYIHRAQQLIDERNKHKVEFNLKEYLLGEHLADIYSGYRNPSLEKFSEMVKFFASEVLPFKTKLNKLLFYADFLMFKVSCYSISGVRYVAIDKGPVPNNFNSIFEYLVNNNEVGIQYVDFPEYTGEKFVGKADSPFNANIFSHKELEVLNTVANKFRNTSTNDIVNLSHFELAWRENHEAKSKISFQYAFKLNHI